MRIEEAQRRKEMIYKLHIKKSEETKIQIDADTKDLAIEYFSAIMHLRKRDLLRIYKVNG
jgi:hypothetical protein